MTELRTILRTMIYHDGKYWIGECLELGLVVAEKDRDSARGDIETVCRAQIGFALKNDLQIPFRTPSLEKEQKYGSLHFKEYVEFEIKGQQFCLCMAE